ncbi:IclR family transcriptional regulator [Rhodoplanes sp. Z2-YC6860]|uniref:IclR family transcriptional regulator n=1 Tax=Rhodoplanes sp. Z2-YC6860 TaxID=674703 RepID=UPI00078E2EA5|nr:IclR family transcriptional regulator [Rhodoplanes sp. Z2-YC6860]AMN39675.1 IclR family transcriptional regulator [Rhodoplanes sp. Z2-YC6860]
MSGSKKSNRRRKAPVIADRGGVQSVRIASTILKALAAGGGALPLKDLASATGLARAKVHRYLTSLRNAGLVSQNADTSHYQIGPAAVEIGLIGLRRISPVAEVCDALPALRDLINQTVTVAVWGDGGPVVVAMQESDHWVTMNIRVGSRLPIATTAIGRIFLAHLPAAVTRPLVTAERRDAQQRKLALPSADEIDGLMSEIRSRRLSRAPSALLPGVDAIAAPVFDYRDNLVAVVCVVARSDAKITGWDGSAVRALTDMTAQLSAKLGFVDQRSRQSKQTDGEAKSKTPAGAIVPVDGHREKTG